MSKLGFLVGVVLWFGVLNSFAQENQFARKSEFKENVLVVKLKPNHRAFFEGEAYKNNTSVQKEIAHYNKTFRYSKPLKDANKKETLKVDLSLIYTISIHASANVRKVRNRLVNLEVFEYVEKLEVNHVAFTPNDVEVSKQSYLTQIKAFAAWDVETGKDTIKIGIVDTGTDMLHSDLQTKIAKNNNDPINGVDDDNDGFVDNFQGWDFVDNDKNPQVGLNNHGAHVSGIAAAATNNSIGVASVGYNTMFIPIRVGNGTSIDFGYEGIVYAADMGCAIINCSWGGFTYSQYAQDMVNYATYNKGALVVAAAGNQGRDQKYYPAAYDNVLAVTSVNSSDEKTSNSNYGYWVDIASPGENVYSTIENGGYNYNTGTSMAAPMVSGAAALVKAKYPHLSALQISERLKSTADDISGLNPGVANKIGKGRLNVFESVNGNINDASVVFEKIKLTNKGDDAFKGNDSLFLSGTFVNYLAISGNVMATVTTQSPYISVNKSVENLGVLNTLDEVDNNSNPFSFQILNTAPLNTEVVFKVEVTDGVFTNDFYAKVIVNVDYLNIAINKLSTSVGSKGQFGYNERNQNQGLGVRYNNGTSQFFEGGLMIGTDNGGVTRVVDRVRNAGSAWDDEFRVVENVNQITAPTIGDYAVKGVFNDSNAFANMIGLKVLHHSYASNDPGHSDYVVFEYQVINTSAVEITNLNVGLFADFDIANFDKNACYTDKVRFVTYTISTEPNTPVFGVQLLSSKTFGSYCLDNVDGGQGGVDIYNGFATDKKFATLTLNRQSSGIHAVEGNDVIQVTSTGGVDLQVGDTMKVAFAILGAVNQAMLKMVADSAYKAYNGVLPNSIIEPLNLSKLIKVYPNPVENNLIIDINHLEINGLWNVRILDVSGRLVGARNNIILKKVEIDLNNLEFGVYLVEIKVGNEIFTTKLIKN